MEDGPVSPKTTPEDLPALAYSMFSVIVMMLPFSSGPITKIVFDLFDSVILKNRQILIKYIIKLINYLFQLRLDV